MKKTGKILTFSAAMIASAGLTGCSKIPAELAQELYSIFSGQADDFDPDDNVGEDIYAGPDFYDDYYEEDNLEEALYAGPDYWDEPSEDSQIYVDDWEDTADGSDW